VPSAFDTWVTATILVRGPNQPGKFVEHQLAAIVDGRDLQVRAFFFAENLPRDDVRVVLHGRDEDFVACADVPRP
jgi:hypothetical protein